MKKPKFGVYWSKKLKKYVTYDLRFYKKMKRLLGASLFLAVGAKAQVAIPIQNSSFESPVTFSETLDCGQYVPGLIPGWNFTQAAGGGGGIATWTCDPFVEDGTQVAFLQQATISQDTGLALSSYVYTLKFFVASRFYWYPGTYKASILMGVTELCPTSGYAQGDWAEITLTCAVPYYISHYNGFGFPPGNLSISISSTSGWGVLVDKVSLTYGTGG
jgi:hypothetical protein